MHTSTPALIPKKDNIPIKQFSAVENSFSTLIPVYMQLCEYPDDGDVKQLVRNEFCSCFLAPLQNCDQVAPVLWTLIVTLSRPLHNSLM